MIRLFGVAILFWGVATTYTAMPGAVLYCDQFCANDLAYTPETAPWVAVTVEWYESGLVECGDTATLLFTNGRSGTFRVFDAGRFQGRWVEGWENMAIRVDLPEFYKPDGKMSWLVIGIIYGSD